MLRFSNSTISISFFLYPTNVAKAEKNIKNASIGRTAFKLETVDENIAAANKISSLVTLKSISPNSSLWFI